MHFGLKLFFAFCILGPGTFPDEFACPHHHLNCGKFHYSKCILAKRKRLRNQLTWMTEWQQTHVDTSIHGIDSYDAWPVFKVMGEQWVLVWIAMVFDQPVTGGQKMTLSMLPLRYLFPIRD